VVIACKHCNTRFQLDDARVPDVGVRVRCSRCKHAFFVAPPGGAEEALHAAAADAAAHEESSAPPPTEDLPPPFEGADARSEAAVEEDWQFNIPESAASGAPEAEDAPPAPLGPMAESAPLADPRSQSGPPDPLPEAPPSLPEARPHETSFEPHIEEDDLRDELFGISDSDPAPEEPGAEAGLEGDQLFGSSEGDLGVEDPELASSAPEAPAAEAEAEAEPEPEREEGLGDLGSPEDWDFIGDGPLPEPKVATAPAATPSAASSATAAPQTAKPEPAGVVDRRVQVPRWMVWRDAAGWLACAVLFIAGLAGAWNGSPEPALRTAPAAELGPLRLQDLRAAVVENLHAGPVWVFRGTLVNPQAESARADVLPRLALLDDSGEVVGEAWFGRSASDEAVRERLPTEVSPKSAAASRHLAQRSLAAGEQLELTAIVERLPDAAVGWRVEEAAVPARPTAARSSTLPSLPSSRE